MNFATLQAICIRFGLSAPSFLPQPWIGATSRVYPLTDVVLKVPHASSIAIAALVRDVLVTPLAGAAGVATPRLIAFDDACDLLPVPYVVSERIQGDHIAKPQAGTPLDTGVWRELGRQLAFVHTRIEAESIRSRLRTFVQTPEVDPRPWVTTLATAGQLGADTAAWLLDTFERLAPVALADLPLAFCHGDINAANVLITRDRAQPVTLIDWSGAGWLDPAWDFVGVPLAVVPEMLIGHRQVSPLIDNTSAEARILWCFLQSAVDRLYRHEMPVSDAATDRWLRAARQFWDYVKI